MCLGPPLPCAECPGNSPLLSAEPSSKMRPSPLGRSFSTNENTLRRAVSNWHHTLEQDSLLQSGSERSLVSSRERSRPTRPFWARLSLFLAVNRGRRVCPRASAALQRPNIALGLASVCAHWDVALQNCLKWGRSHSHIIPANTLFFWTQPLHLLTE